VTTRPLPDRAALLLAVPLLLAAAAYRRVLHGEFLYDDLATGAGRPSLPGLGAVASGAWASFWRGGRPVADLTFALDRWLGGLDPWGAHVVSAGLHLLTAVLVWRLALAVLGLAGAARVRGQALAVAGIWALHPLQSQAVSYLTQRAEVLASLFMVAALLAFLGAERAGLGRRAWPRLGLALLAFAAALGAKAMAVTLPALWALVAWAAPGPAARAAGPGWRSRGLALALPAALAIGHGAATVRGLDGAGNAGFEVAGLDPWSYLLTQLRVVATYLRLLLWPAGQSVDWAVEPSRSLAEPAALACGLLLLLLGAGAVALVVLGRRRDGEDRAAARVAGLGLLWFLLVLAPTSTVVPLADLLVEHRPYLASLGVVLAAVALGERAAARLRWRQAGLAAMGVVAALWLALAAALHARNAVWESGLALWRDATAGGRGTARASIALGNELARLGDPGGALAAYRMAFDKARGRPFEEAHALHNAGVLLAGAGRLDEAERVMRGATQRAPRGAEMAYLLAWILFQRGAGSAAEAATWAERALAIDAGHGKAAHLLALLRAEAGRTEEGLALLSQAAEKMPGEPAVLRDLGGLLRRAGRPVEACQAWDAALRRDVDGRLTADLEALRAQAGCPR